MSQHQNSGWNNNQQRNDRGGWNGGGNNNNRSNDRNGGNDRQRNHSGGGDIGGYNSRGSGGGSRGGHSRNNSGGNFQDGGPRRGGDNNRGNDRSSFGGCRNNSGDSSRGSFGGNRGNFSKDRPEFGASRGNSGYGGFGNDSRNNRGGDNQEANFNVTPVSTAPPEAGWSCTKSRYEFTERSFDLNSNPQKNHQLETQLFNNGYSMNTGIDFKKYKELEVTVKGNAPTPIFDFQSANFHPVVFNNVQLMKYTEPTPVQVITNNNFRHMQFLLLCKD